MKCEACPFNNQTPVHGEGTITQDQKLIAVKEDRQWDVVAVGMAPAMEEVKQGRPFVGVSGQILRKILYQFDIQEYYVCNVFLCPISDDSLVPQAQECCRSVIDEILSKKPKLVIALGDLPLHTLADTPYRIKEIEGRIIPSKVGPLLPITHPAYYWRHPDQFYDFLECLRPSVKFLNGQYYQAEEPTSTIVTSGNLSQVLGELDRYEELAVDLETTGFFSHGWEPDRILEMGIAGDHKHAYIIPNEMVEEFKDLLESKKGIYWNAQFDAGFLKQRGITPNVHFDGMLAHYTIDERPYSHGLKKVAMRYLGAENWEEDLDKYIPKRQKKSVSYEVVPQDVRYGYLAKDVTRTFQLMEPLKEDLNKKVFWDMLMPASRMFIEIEHKGMRIDPVKLMEMEKTLGEDLEVLDDKISDLAGSWVNPLSPKQVSELLYQTMGLPVDPYMGPTTSKAYLEQFREAYEVIGTILDYRELAKLKGTYVEGFAKHVDSTFRIHPSIKLFGSITGRLSSENPSIMNIKSLGRLKEIFLPEVGHVLLYSDVKGNELRWYCVISGDPELTEILRTGGDPHHIVAMSAYGEARARELRTPAKAVVFGRIYKRGRKDIERQVGRDVIDDVMAAVDDVAPNIDAYYKEVVRQIRTQGYLESYFGRRRRFSLLTPETFHEVERQGVNFGPQSAGSDLMLKNMLHLWEVKDQFGIWPFWPYHDSITMDAIDKGVLPLVKKELEDYSLALVNGVMPFPWEMDWGIDWSMRKE